MDENELKKKKVAQKPDSQTAEKIANSDLNIEVSTVGI